MKKSFSFFCVSLLCLSLCSAQTDDKGVDLSTFKWRSIGPAFMSGRISDLAVDPINPSTYYIGVASGGIFKTVNSGTTYEPIFDSYGSYSIGSLTIDPSNHHVIWVGTGEANHQRSVAYGDGVYKSEDGGKSFKNMGLKNSNHIGKIIVHPEFSNIIYVAAYGPLWDSGGERGVYKSTDGGSTWSLILAISEHTGVADIVMDPRNPERLYASAHQRQRKGYGYVSGGPESGLHKSEDGGKTWTSINKGLPSVDKGRIAIAISPINPDVLYCHLEAADNKNGSYKSTDRGASWVKQSDYASSGLYYGRIFPDPLVFDKLFVGDVYSKVTLDGGKNYSNLSMSNVHVDNHVFWINPNNNQHIMMGGDGGLYETWDDCATWQFKPNLSITQFYRVATDNSFPFYYVYGGTQDNSSMGGPSRTINSAGIPNHEWFLTNGGDGFESQVDWENPNIVYAQAQHGWLVRYDRATGERVRIKPVELDNEPALRWNWDSPLVVSRHDSKRIYFGANKIYQSDDRGNSWRLISGDLSRQIDRNTLPYMGKVWSVDAVKKNTSTSIWGQTTFISESILDDQLLYVGTDDGLIQITTDGGTTWRKVDNIPGAPTMSYVPQIICSEHDKSVAYVIFNHHRYGDYKPYVFRTGDGGKTWQSIASNLPVRGSLYTIAEDHVDPNLLFVGSDFGAFVSVDRGVSWQKLSNGLPTIAVKDMEIQRRENDLVIASFGRGFYILDDYSSLREMAKDQGSKENKMYPVKDTWLFQESSPLGGGSRSPYGTQGDSYYAGQNPPVGAVFRYQVADVAESRKDRRKKVEKAAIAANNLKGYPPLDSLVAEEYEIMPYYLIQIKNANGEIIVQVKQQAKKGVNQFVWDLKTNNGYTINPRSNTGGNAGLPVLPGYYSADLAYFDGQSFSVVAAGQPFEVKSLGWATLPAQDKTAVYAQAKEQSEFARIVFAACDHLVWLKEKHTQLKAALLAHPTVSQSFLPRLYEIENTFGRLEIALNGNGILEGHQFEVLPGIRERVASALWASVGHQSDIPKMYGQSLALAKKEFVEVYEQLEQLDKTLKEIQTSAEAFGVPYIKGSLPTWDRK